MQPCRALNIGENTTGKGVLILLDHSSSYPEKVIFPV